MFKHPDIFLRRHLGPDEADLENMLATIGVSSLEELINQTLPEQIRLTQPLKKWEAQSEYEYLQELKTIAAQNKCFKSYIGLGYYDCITPAPILRNIFENPGWYTQYTPYQAEISQGRLEALLNFQTVVSDLTALPIANASLLDEATAAAEAMGMCLNQKRRKDRKSQADTILISETCFPQTIEVVKTRASGLGIKVVVKKLSEFEITDEIFAAIVQYPEATGEIHTYQALADQLHAQKSYLIVAADLMSLSILKAPGNFGADVAIGSSQRLGVPLGYGGPHAAYYATKNEFLRLIPGRIIGVSIDTNGKPAMRMTLQTREQHIKRDKATSNICTAQALLAIISGMYAVYHGPKGLKAIASRIHTLTRLLEQTLRQLGINLLNEHFFDTLSLQCVNAEAQAKVKEVALQNKLNFYYPDETHIQISIDECTGLKEVQAIVKVFETALGKQLGSWKPEEITLRECISPELIRTTEYLAHPVFNTYHSETALMRYIKQLENKDLSLNTAMIPLGSCTMKLNAASELIPVSWPEFSSIHPFVPQNQIQGYQQIISELGDFLCKITGFADFSFQPNSGAQGEYAGLMVIRAYHHSRGDLHRNVAIVPASAHGTNPASAVMAGMKVVVVKTDEMGNIDLEDLKTKAARHQENLAALMITYPSTHGVFEEEVKKICELIHHHGGQVYMDGANMNAQVGLTSPAFIGADVCHLNLHKTFSIPHGGGGPGMGPIGVAEHLVPFLPGHSLVETGGKQAMTAIAATPYGSSSILLISYAYLKLLGSEGATEATKYAILNANYLKARLEKHYQILFEGKNGRVAHEFIIDLREFKQKWGLGVDDITKRLIDYGFHAPTVSWPVPGTIMIEPTESEPKEELDRFCDTMIAISAEVKEIEMGLADMQDNVLKHAPHTLDEVSSDEWEHAYSRQKAAFPLASLRANKFWPAVARVNNTYGDRNVVCVCPPLEAYEEIPKTHRTD